MSLISTYTRRNLESIAIHRKSSEVSDQTVSMCRLILIFAVRYLRVGFAMTDVILLFQDMLALTGTGPERMFEFPEPLVTASFRITPKLHNIYPCFRFSVFACDATGEVYVSLEILNKEKENK